MIFILDSKIIITFKIKKKRLVDEYVRENDNSPYRKVREDVEFSQYMTDNKYHIIPISQSEQLKYGCNCLNLGNGNLICINSTFFFFFLFQFFLKTEQKHFKIKKVKLVVKLLVLNTSLEKLDS